MRKIKILTTLSVISIAVIYTAHYHPFELFGWTRVLISAPIVYAGMNFRRAGAVSVALLLVLAEGPLIVKAYAVGPTYGVEFALYSLVISIASVLYGHVLRKERENSNMLDQTHGLVRSMRGSMDEDGLLTVLENVFKERSKTSQVAVYLFGEDGRLRPRTYPGGEPLPSGHLFHAVAENREFMVSINPAQDLRLVYYGPPSEKERIVQLAAFPIEYGGRVRGIISIANSEDEFFGKESVSYLDAVKKTVENTLDLGEKLRGRIQHEIQGRKIRDAFSSYLSQTVADKILKDPDMMGLGGEVRDVTIMFTEVANFEELMKTVPPEKLLSRLNQFFSAAIDTVFELDGTLDKFIGNNIMAFWGAPLSIPDGENKAVTCARELQRKIAALNTGWELAGERPFNVCIGINSGPVVAGNIGGVRRMEYTVIGDTVNTAARIKSLSKSKGLPVLIGETTYSRVKDTVKIEQRIEAAVKGKTDSITVYQAAV